MSEWRETTLGEVCELKRGYDLPASSRKPGNVPIVSSSGISGHHSVAKVSAPGVVTGRYGTLGDVYFIDEDFWPLNTSLYVRDFKGNEPRFIAALLLSLNLGRSEAAAAVPGVNRNHLHVLPVRCPDLCTQRSIGDVFRAIDDLIENNARRIAILEEMARAIYREWFVEFRYPGHENVPLVESELGMIPEGWGVGNLGSITENFDRLRRPISSLKRSEMQGEFPYYGAAKIVDHINDWIFEGEYLLFAEDGTVITGDGYPVLQLVNERFWVNNHTHILKGSELPTRFLWLAMAIYPISGHITGAAQPKITQANLNRVPIVIPAAEVLCEFMAQLDPMIDLLQILVRRNRLLRTKRDLLLPRLVSGQIDVSHIELPEAV